MLCLSRTRNFNHNLWGSRTMSSGWSHCPLPMLLVVIIPPLPPPTAKRDITDLTIKTETSQTSSSYVPLAPYRHSHRIQSHHPQCDFLPRICLIPIPTGSESTYGILYTACMYMEVCWWIQTCFHDFHGENNSNMHVGVWADARDAITDKCRN